MVRLGWKTVSCVTRRVLTGANESRNLIPTGAGKPMASHGGTGDENVLYQVISSPLELFIDKQQVIEDSVQSLDALYNCSIEFFFFSFLSFVNGMIEYFSDKIIK